MAGSDDVPRKRPTERGRGAPTARPQRPTGGPRSSGGERSPGAGAAGGRTPPRAAGARPSTGGKASSDRGARLRSGSGEEREWTYDPRREARRQLTRVPLPDDVDARDLDRDTRKELMSLSKDTADLVARHLVMAGRLMDEQPEQALAHARAARALAGRVGAVREANGLVAYTAAEWSEALSELRTARRLTGQPDHLAVMADCERALGRPDRALLVAEDPQAASLGPADRVELLIVASGARRDMGQPEAAVVSLQIGALEGPVRPWTARLRYAYADALLEAGREDEARQWFARAADVDELGETDAEERLLALDGVVFDDLQTGDEELADAGTEPGTEGMATVADESAPIDLVALLAHMSTPRPSEAGPEPETAPSDILRPAPAPTAGPPAVAPPAFQAPPARDDDDEDAEEDDRGDGDLRLFD